MRVQVKVIRFTLLMSIFFAVITYLVTLNIEIVFLIFLFHGSPIISY